MSEQTKHSMVIYPNPSSGSFQINWVDGGQLRMASLSGNLILDQDYDKVIYLIYKTLNQDCSSFEL
jgi:hypothetical protein